LRPSSVSRVTGRYGPGNRPEWTSAVFGTGVVWVSRGLPALSGDFRGPSPVRGKLTVVEARRTANRRGAWAQTCVSFWPARRRPGRFRGVVTRNNSRHCRQEYQKRESPIRTRISFASCMFMKTIPKPRVRFFPSRIIKSGVTFSREPAESRLQPGLAAQQETYLWCLRSFVILSPA